MGYLDYNGKPYGLAVLARAGDDGLLLQFMSAFEAVFAKRQVPPRLLKDLTGKCGMEKESMM